MSKKEKNKSKLRYQIAEMFNDAGYEVDADAFGDKSASWLNITKKDNPGFELELTFNFKGTKFKSFDVWKTVIEVTDTKKIF